MTIRPATNADAEVVRALVFEVLEEYGLKPDPDGIDADLRDIEARYVAPGGMFDVAEDEGRIVGSVGLCRKADGVCELRKMYLARSARGQGLGKGLLEHALDRARALGFRRVELETAGVLVEAIRLYTRRGFRPVEPAHLSARCDRAFALDLD
jgi:putative acetyltransferase